MKEEIIFRHCKDTIEKAWRGMAC